MKFVIKTENFSKLPFATFVINERSCYFQKVCFSIVVLGIVEIILIAEIINYDIIVILIYFLRNRMIWLRPYVGIVYFHLQI